MSCLCADNQRRRRLNKINRPYSCLICWFFSLNFKGKFVHVEGGVKNSAGDLNFNELVFTKASRKDEILKGKQATFNSIIEYSYAVC